MALDRPIRCDGARIAQLLSNLLANALMHGAAEAPIEVRASSRTGIFELSVANRGEPIPPDTMTRLFQPFFRAPGRSAHQGLGLGLYIASEIARAHGGTLSVESTPAATRFSFKMPVD
jgi:sigma-B regulation protein RsbU (phosphoserine phosphatase)